MTDLKWFDGDQGDEEEHGRHSQQVQEVTHQRRPQLLPAADTWGDL